MDGRQLEEVQRQAAEGAPHRGLEPVAGKVRVVLGDAPEVGEVPARALVEAGAGRLHPGLDPGPVALPAGTRHPLQLGLEGDVVDALQLRPEADVGVVPEAADDLQRGLHQLQRQVVRLDHHGLGGVAEQLAPAGIRLPAEQRLSGEERELLAVRQAHARGRVEGRQAVVEGGCAAVDDALHERGADATRGLFQLPAGRLLFGGGGDLERLVRVQPGVALDDLGDVLLLFEAGANEAALGVDLLVRVAQAAHHLVVGHPAHHRFVQLYHWSR